MIKSGREVNKKCTDSTLKKTVDAFGDQWSHFMPYPPNTTPLLNGNSMVTKGFRDGTETVFRRRCAEDFA